MSKVKFDGEANSPELDRLTAKKNYASSMQSHKMGATLIFNMIYKHLAEEKYPALQGGARNVAVKQLPILGFLKTKLEGTDQYNYRYIGNFTVGADKGDKNWFGFSEDGVKDRIIRLEGTDHIKGAGFNYPWRVGDKETMKYSLKHESICIVKGNSEDEWTKVLEVSQCGNKKTQEEISAYLKERMMPAYECAYHANPLIAGTTATLEEMNADVEAFGLNTRADKRKFSYCEIWRDGEYDLYYINASSGKYEKNGINLYNELPTEERAKVDAATSIEEKNRIFIDYRINRFKDASDAKYGAANFFCIDDLVYQIAILFILVASDNFEKNMYPYLMDALIRFLQDDLDSILSTDNQAQDTKRYSAELDDFTDETESAYVFKGEDSALFQAVRLAFAERIQTMGRDILQAMYDLSPTGSTTPDKLMGFFDAYFFGRAQDYFTKSMYNDDAEYAYEEAWNNKKYVSDVDIHPLAQSLGDHYAVERAFLEKRLIFLMSKFGFGSYSNYEDTSLGRISFRTQVPQSFTLTPAIDSYPTILGGASGTVKASRRINAGESVTLSGVGGGNTNVYIVGADWLSDIGDLKDLQIDPSSVVALSVSSKRLRRLKVGDENAAEVTSQLATLSVQRCDSIESVDARNLTTLTGTVDLTQCPRLIQALFGNTDVRSVLIAAGSKVEHIQLPDSVSTIDLRNTKFLERFEYGTLANVNFLRLENVPVINGFAMLRDVYNTEGQVLNNIRVIGWEYDGNADDLAMLADFTAKDGESYKYKGIDANGKPTDALPVLEGTLNIADGVYQDDIDSVQNNFGGITINYDPLKIYVKFADPEVLRVLLANKVGDGIGITTEDIEKVTGIAGWFYNNTTIESFDELEKFTGVNTLKEQSFYGCTNLNTIKFPRSLTTIERYAFRNCSALAIEVNCPNLTGTLPYGTFTNSGVTKVTNLGSITTITSYDNSVGVFGGCANLTNVILPASLIDLGAWAFYNCSVLANINLGRVKKIGNSAFYNCTSLEIEDLSLPNLETLGQNAFYGVKIKKISNLGKLTTLPTASNTTQNFGDKSVLEEVVLPSGVTEIPAQSFYNYSALVKINLDNIITINGSTFNSTSIRDAILPNIVSTGSYSFANNKSIEKVLFGSNIATIGDCAFQNNSSLQHIICLATTPPSVYTTSFRYIHSDYYIYVPDASVEAYRTASGWSSYADRIRPLSEYDVRILTYNEDGNGGV